MTRTRYYLDTEFQEDTCGIELISIGIVCEDGRNMYAVSNEFVPARCNEWVRENVLPQLPPVATWESKLTIRKRVKDFVTDRAPEFWAYFADYDWVLFCQLFGTMRDLPSDYPMLCMDLQQYALHLGVETSLKGLVPMRYGEHDALEDALWNRRVHEALIAKDRK